MLEDKMLMFMRELELSGSGWPPVTGCCEYRDELCGPTSGMEALDEQSDR
jgi:hypothetical protein